jgi:hypothetical protein
MTSRRGFRFFAALLVGLDAVLLGTAGCSKARQADPELVATAGSQEIRSAEFEAAMRRRSVGNEPAAKSALLEELLDHAALVETARAAGLDRDPELQRSWENLLVAKLREVRLEPRQTNAQPTAEQVRSHDQSNQVRFTEPAMRRGAVLFAEVPSKAEAARRAQVRARLEEARTKALAQDSKDPSLRGFGPLAVEYSEDQATRYRGGDFGWIQAGRGDVRYDRLVVDSLFALPPQSGALSEVLETPRGFYLVKLLENREARVKPLESVEAALRHQLLIANQARLEAEWKAEARAAVKTEVFPEVLARIRVPDAPTSPVVPPSLP